MREQEAAPGPLGLGITRATTPRVATLFRVFRDLNVAAFEAALAGWLGAQGVPAGEALALDGKTLRGIHGEQIPSVHLVAAYARGRGAVRGEKGGHSRAELTLATAPLGELDLHADIVAGDAEYCQQRLEAGRSWPPAGSFSGR